MIDLSKTYERILVLAENQMKKILLNCLSVRSSTGTGRIPVSCFSIRQCAFSDQKIGVNLSIPPPKSTDV
jgi:hypothetical protein